MLNKKEMEKFASQYIKGKIKLYKNTKIYGKPDTYSCFKDDILISFEEKSIIIKLSKTETKFENFDRKYNKLDYYLKGLKNFIDIENKFRDGYYDRPLNGQIDSEIIFQVKCKNITQETINLKFYIESQERDSTVNSRYPCFEFFLFKKRYEEVFLKMGQHKNVTGDLRILQKEVVQEILDFNLILDDVFEDQLKTLEMALS